ncbi:MAG: hypothetical protein ACRD0A_18595 [Acidimicrobiales bacterium]
MARTVSLSDVNGKKAPGPTDAFNTHGTHQQEAHSGAAGVPDATFLERPFGGRLER